MRVDMRNCWPFCFLPFLRVLGLSFQLNRFVLCTGELNVIIYLSGPGGSFDIALHSINSEDLYRSHFGSRYHTRADAVTQAFLILQVFNSWWRYLTKTPDVPFKS